MRWVSPTPRTPDRWYWAVLTAFLVFTGVSTRGDLLSRAGHRIVGTIAGVLAGVLLATLIGQNPPVQIVVLVICVFCAFYLVTVAYAWLTFFVTVELAMLYGLLGNFSVQVLELRIGVLHLLDRHPRHVHREGQRLLRADG